MKGDDQGKLRKFIEAGLQDILTKFKVEKFDHYLAHFEQTKDLRRFVDDLFNNMDLLQLKTGDILKLLKKIGSKSSIREGFGYSFFVLWLEFLLIEEINSKDRINTDELLKFATPKEEKQMEALKDIFYSYGASATEDEIKKVLEQIKAEQLFKEMLAVKENDPKENKFKQVSKSSLLSLNSKQIANIFVGVLTQINQIIGVITKIQDFEETMQKIKDLINDILSRSYSLQRQVMIGYLSSAILNILGVQIKKNNCRLHEQTSDAIKRRFQHFKQFLDFQKLLIENDDKKVKIADVLDRIEKLLNDGIKSIWYWPTYDKKSLIVSLIQRSFLEDQIDKLVKIMTCYTPNSNNKNSLQEDLVARKIRSYAPNMAAPIFDDSGREFLEQILTQTPKQVKFGKFNKCLLKYVKDQDIDLDKQLKNGVTYRILFQIKGVPYDSSIMPGTVPVSALDSFHIYCYRTKRRQQLFISPEDRQELFDKFKDGKFYESLKFSCQGYNLECQLTDKKAFGRYSSGKMNLHHHYQTNVQYEGILNYGSVAKFQAAVKDFKWMIILSEKWEQIKFSLIQNDNITQQVVKNIYNQENIFKMRLSTGASEILIEVNLQTMIVNQLINTSNSPISSMMKNRFGYLVYFPAYKTKSISLAQQDIGDDDIEDTIQSQKQSMSEVTMAQYEQQQTLDQNFEFLAVFKLYFHTKHEYIIDKNENVLASSKATGYFKNWLDHELYSLMDEHLVVKEGKGFHNIKKDFKLSRKLFPKFKDEMKLCKTRMNIRLDYQYNDKNENLIIVNLKKQPESREFYEAYMKYVTLKIGKESQKKGFTMEVTEEQKDYLKGKKHIRVEDKGTNIVEVVCTKEEKQKLLKEVSALDETHQFTYQNSAAYKLMKNKEEKYLKSINLAEIYVGQDFFKVSMKLRGHPTFKQKLIFYHRKIQQQDGDVIQRKMEKEADFLHIYRSQFQKQNIQIDISKIGKDLLLQYKQKLEKAVKKVLSKIGEAKQRELFKISKGQSQQYVFANIQITFLFKLKDKLVQILNRKPQIQIKPVIDVRMDKNNYILRVLQIQPEQQKIVDKQVLHFNNRVNQFAEAKKQIVNTSKLSNDIFHRIPNDEVQSKLIKQMRYKFKRHLGQLLNEIITEIIQKTLKRLQQQFSDFIKNQRLDSVFTTKQKIESQKNILGQISRINIFESYLLQFLREKSEQLKKNVDKNVILKDITPILESTNAKFIDSSIKFGIKDLESFFKSVNIFTEIYYGKQLPITQHLKKFNELFQSNDVVLVKVGTGSGKSTVIPPYLVGLGYKKVVVTQPRRLPCVQIYNRVSDVFGSGVCGYEVADEGKDRKNSLIYMTDGLLKMRAQYNLEELDKIDVLIIDEIHQRSANIDILLILLNQYYKIAKRKLKLVLCSATIDKKIGQILKDANLQIATFEVNVQRHPVTEHRIEKGDILSRILELTARLEGDQQMLVFYSSVAEVKQMVNLLQKRNHKAYPVMAEQNPRQQAEFLKVGQIFVATAIAETSLTFKNLKFVVDSRMSRWRKFNPVVELMQTQEDFSSNSSIAQRKGRLGRTCPGQYHYFVYSSQDLKNNRQHNRTELENNDLTPYIYELLLRQGATLKGVQYLMKKLRHEQYEFNKKFQYSLQILKDLNVIGANNSLTNVAAKMKVYGNLGHPQHNYALYQASENNCTIDMIYLVSFLMMGMNRSGQILKDLKSQPKGGDLRTIHNFLANIAAKIDLKTIDSHNQIKRKIRQNCSNVSGKPWFSVIVRVMRKARDLLKICQNNVTVSDWSLMIATLLQSYKNKIFFNHSVFGGNKANYQKIRKDAFCFEQKQKQTDETLYKIDLNSLTSHKDNPPPIVLSLNCAISPQNECVLSICEVLDPSKVREQIKIKIIGFECQSNYFKDSQPLNERQLFNNLQIQIPNRYNFVRVDSNFPQMELTGNFQPLSKAFGDFIQHQRRNEELKIDVKKILEEVIAGRLIQVQNNPMLAVIKKEYSMFLLQKLTNKDMKKMFQTMKFQMSNNYGVEIQWDATINQTLIIVKKSKNLHLSKIIYKIYSFCRWFADSQTICKEQFKIKPQFIEDTNYISKDDKQKIMERVNQIVDSRLDHHTVKGWANGSGPSTRYPRTARMIAVCWVLTNVFNCVIKGGFVRDWVVNNKEVLPPTNLRNLLQPNPRNNFIEVTDDSVTPSDIDAQLHDFTLLDKERLIKQMKKIGVPVIIEEDGWRKHIIFDKDSQTGGFTADLIEPYTSMCHDTYDFDVNILYIKKDHLNSIGQKIPLEYQNKFCQKIKTSLEQLLSLCRKYQMRKLKESIPEYRLRKFQARGWKINRNQFYQPLIYTDYFTKSSSIPPNSIQSICPVFHQRMVVEKNYKIVRIESLKNKAWDDSFESVQHWIITEIEKAKGGQNINSNNKMLFHGSTQVGIEGIKQAGFDSRFYASYGYYGRGAYFADDPQYSDIYAPISATDNCKKMFVAMVALGQQEELKKQTKEKLGPSKGFHSICGFDRGHGEYIIDRWGQAKALYLITYRS